METLSPPLFDAPAPVVAFQQLQTLLETRAPGNLIDALDCSDEDGFSIPADQFKAGFRLSVDGSGRIRGCPVCGQRHMLAVAYAGSHYQVCADALGDSPSCTFYHPL